jgi:hypothetical protein
MGPCKSLCVYWSEKLCISGFAFLELVLVDLWIPRESVYGFANNKFIIYERVLECSSLSGLWRTGLLT